MVDETVWRQEISWICPVCGFKILECEMHIKWKDNEREHDLAVCPICGTQSIISFGDWL